MGLGTGEIVLIFLAILLVFGAKRIPEIARGLGHGIREFKHATSDIKRELMVDDSRTPPVSSAPGHDPRKAVGETVGETVPASPPSHASTPETVAEDRKTTADAASDAGA